MRFTSILGIGGVVIVVAAVAFMGLRSGNEVAVDESLEAPEVVVDEVTNSGQFFQEIPADELGGDVVVPTSEVLPESDVAEELSEVAAEAVTITMSETGFAPETVAIAAGTEVVFVNNGQATHWPASDSHPTHTILAGFDSKRGLATGETYTYTFTKPGVWRCHDHMMPQLTCVVTVSE